MILRLGAMAALLTMLSTPAPAAEQLLFIGNSFTIGAGDDLVKAAGGVPALVKAIAESRGKSAEVMRVVAGGKDFGYHLAAPATAAALPKRPWDWVVLQDYSTKPTHMGSPAEFMKNGDTFYDRITAAAPGAKIALYETWAYGAKNSIYNGTGGPRNFANPEEMMGELATNYTALQKALQARDPKRQVALAPVGLAFAQSLREHPEIDLHSLDMKHPSRYGSYLAALVIYATIYDDTPVGATGTFPKFTIEPDTAKVLQTVAAKVTGH